MLLPVPHVPHRLGHRALQTGPAFPRGHLWASRCYRHRHADLCQETRTDFITTYGEDKRVLGSKWGEGYSQLQAGSGGRGFPPAPGPQGRLAKSSIYCPDAGTDRWMGHQPHTPGSGGKHGAGQGWQWGALSLGARLAPGSQKAKLDARTIHLDTAQPERPRGRRGWGGEGGRAASGESCFFRPAFAAWT